MITTNKSKQDPLKEIRAIKASLRDPGKLMLDLRADKLTKYLDYRLAQLVNRRIALLPGEQRYLLSETGPGHLRFDPEILDIVAPGTLLTSENALYNERQIEEVITIKRDIEKHLDEALNRPELQDMIKEGLELHLGDLIIESRDPLILSGDMEGRTMILFFYNNEWLMPNNSLIDDLKYTASSTLTLKH